jgi:hypothetical protein
MVVVLDGFLVVRRAELDAHRDISEHHVERIEIRDLPVYRNDIVHAASVSPLDAASAHSPALSPYS